MATTVRVPIDLRSPGFTINAGNSFWLPIGLTAHDLGAWQFLNDVDGSVFGIGYVPTNLDASPAASVVLILAANATSGVTSMNVLTGAVAKDAESMDPGSLTSVGVVDITVPGTAYDTQEQSYALAVQPAADDILIVEVFHDGNTANDTLAVNTILVAAYLEITLL